VSQPAAARPDAIRRHNLGLVLSLVHRRGELTRAQLTQALGLNRSTIGDLVADLSELGLLREHVPTGANRVGRPSHVVGPRPDGPYAVAVDLEADSLTSAAVAIGGQILARRESKLDPEEHGPITVAEKIAGHVEELAAATAPGAWAVGLGVSVPGLVRASDGVVEVAPNLEWRGKPFRAVLNDRLPGLPAEVGNDADLGVLAERVRGAAGGSDDVIYLTGKIGVGAGIIVGGNALRGHDGLAGEVGHVVFDPGGPPCHCGGRGCVETYVGEAALLRAAGRDIAPSRESVAAVFADARAGDLAAIRAVSQIADSLGRVAANLVNLLNPQLIVLGGSLGEILTLAGDTVEASLTRHALAAVRSSVSLTTAGLGEDSSLLGAAELAFQVLIADPVRQR